MTPTLASLYGIPVPINNLGSLIPGAFDGFESRDKLVFAHRNAQQLFKVLEQSVADVTKGIARLNVQ
jgi:hypothetical protein